MLHLNQFWIPGRGNGSKTKSVHSYHDSATTAAGAKRGMDWGPTSQKPSHVREKIETAAPHQNAERRKGFRGAWRFGLIATPPIKVEGRAKHSHLLSFLQDPASTRKKPPEIKKGD